MTDALQSLSNRIVIRASAGTGKTYRLSSWFLQQLFRSASLDQMLATTFTRKAAREILDRIITNLAKSGLDPERCRELSDAVQTPDLTPGDCLEQLEQITAQLHRVRVSTLDRFFSQIATHCCLDLGLPPGWSIIEDNEDRELRREAMEQLLQEDREEQGDRKEREDLVRLMHLVTVGESQRSITRLLREAVKNAYSIYLESSPSAWQRFPELHPLSASELQRAVEDLENLDLPKTKKGQPHSHWLKAWTAAVRAVDNSDWEAFLDTSISGCVLYGKTTYSRKEIDEPVKDVFDRLIQHTRGVIVPQMAQQTWALNRLLDRYHVIYTRLKEEHRVQTYDDVSRRLGQALRSLDLSRIAFRLDARLQHLLLDEFQDTSLSQWEILRPFARQVTQGRDTQRRSFFCVGDVKQAIYSWRGGVAEIFDTVEDELPGLHVESLELSWRSSPAVMETVNRVFGEKRLLEHPKLQTPHRESVEAWCEQFAPHQTVLKDAPGYCCLKTTASVEDEEFESGDDNERELNQNSVTVREAADLVERLSMEAPRRSIGILCRRNDTVAEVIFELRRRGVQASEEGGNPLTDSAAVEAVLAALRIADHPGDTLARFHVAKSPVGTVLGFPDNTDDEAAHQLSRTLRWRIAGEGLATVLQEWVDAMRSDCSPRDLRRLQQLTNLARTSVTADAIRTRHFIDLVRHERIEDPSGARVRVMTVHKAKGLEFDIVVLPELETSLDGMAPRIVAGRPTPVERADCVSIYRNRTIQKLLPEDFQRVFESWTREAVTQSLCLLYVALTRARHATYMLIAPTRTRKWSFPTTVSSLLRLTLAESTDPVPAETTLFEVGDPEWHGQDNDSSEDTSDEPPKSAVKDHIALAPMTGGRRRGLTASEPSEQEGGRTVRINQLLSLDRAQRLERGTLLHRWFEQIEWLDEATPDPESLRQIAGRHGAPGIDVDQELERFEEFLSLERTSQILSRGEYRQPRRLAVPAAIQQELSETPCRLEVHREWGFTAPDQTGGLVTGVIDRLVLLHDPQSYALLAADILDYKTDDIPGDDDAIQTRVAFYTEQLQAYRQAVSHLYRLPQERISARLLFVTIGEVRDVSAP